MNRELLNKWILALESGEYQQGQFCLDRGDGRYCCLGVLCCVAEKEGIPVIRREKEIVGCNLNMDQPAVKKEISLTNSMESALMQTNDNGGTFLEIAQYLRREFNV